MVDFVATMKRVYAAQMADMQRTYRSAARSVRTQIAQFNPFVDRMAIKAKVCLLSARPNRP